MRTQHTTGLLLPASMTRCFACWRLSAAAMLAALLGFLNTAAALEPVKLMEGFDQARLKIVTACGESTEVSVYVAKTPRQHAQGLMNVRSMKSHEGMLFIYARAAPITMWMKNTYIPLDMIFADAQGRIVHMHAGAKPHDTTVISSVAKAALVLELNAGSIEEFGIAVGDRISLLPEKG